MAGNGKEFTVSAQEQAVIQPLRLAVRANQEALGRYLANVAVDRWGFNENQLLNFDLTDVEANKVKVSVVEDGQSNNERT